MKLTYCLSSVVFFVYFSVVVLVIVNGQPTTDDDSHANEIVELREELARALVRISKMEGECHTVGRCWNTCSLHNKIVGHLAALNNCS